MVQRDIKAIIRQMTLKKGVVVFRDWISNCTGAAEGLEEYKQFLKRHRKHLEDYRKRGPN